MKEQDFYSLHIGQKLYYKGEKVKVEYRCTSHTQEEKYQAISFTPKTRIKDLLKWKDICKDCSLEPPFEVKKDCKYFCKHVDGEPHSCIFEKEYYWIDKDNNCFQCPDYEKKKKLVRYYACTWGEFLSWEKEGKFITPKDHTEIKICTETNRIFIEVEE
jgi:hypothetical protein